MSDTKPSAVAEELGVRLRDAGWMCACAESCTGGLLAAALTDLPGSSHWFDRGFVTYSNAAKVQHLRVNVDTLERFGAVSEETAMEMASGVLAAAEGVQLALSTTGIAGPGGATPGKPVGMVCFGFAQRVGQGIVTRGMTQIFKGGRDEVRRAAVEFALQTALDMLPPR